MPKTRSGRLVFALVVCAALFVIGRNLYHRWLNNALLAAINARNVPAVRSLLDRGADANATQTFDDGKFRASALGNASAQFGPESDTMVCLLIEHGANIHDPPDASTTYLEGVCRSGRVAVARCLLEHGADPNVVDTSHETALSYAIRYGRPASYWTQDGVTHMPPQNEQARSRGVSQEIAALLRQHGARVTLRQAAQLEDMVQAQAALQAGANVNEPDRSGQTALHTAAEIGSLPLLRLLLDHSANVNMQDADGCAPLSLAAGYEGREAHADAIKLLLDRGANINVAGRYVDPPLMIAITYKHADIARLLLSRGADPNQTRLPPYRGPSPLITAIRNLPAVVPDLVSRKADVNEADASPLATAISAHRPELVRYLLAHGANVNGAKGSPLAAAAGAGDLNLARDLLARHADVNGGEGAALVAAIRARKPDMARFLLGRGAKSYPPRSRPALANAPAGHVAGFRPQLTLVTTPSTLAVAVTDAPECFDLLMQAGADITPDKPDILLAAAAAGHAVLFDRLIALGANVNALDREGNTPLTLAFQRAPDGIKTLLEHGANPNVVHPQAMQTPLIMAAQAGNTEATRLLLAHGANAGFKPPRSHTALYFARRHKNVEVARLLEQAGAKDE